MIVLTRCFRKNGLMHAADSERNALLCESTGLPRPWPRWSVWWSGSIITDRYEDVTCLKCRKQLEKMGIL